MASRADDALAPAATGGRDAPELPALLRLRGALRAALSDFYFNSLRLVAANIVWSSVLAGVYLVFLVWPGGAIMLSPILALPTAGIYSLSSRIVRGEPASVSDALEAWPKFGARAIGFGAAVVALALVLSVNIVVGFAEGGFVGWAIATLAFWGLAAGSTVALVAWPLLVDPARPDRPLREGLRLAAYLVLAFPARFGAMTLLLGAILVASTVAFAALVTISVSFSALVSARYVLPASDRFEAQMQVRARARPT